jgi:hypothetical protein
MNDQQRFEVAREIVRHEDGLVNHRVTWLLVLQGFLFGAFVNGVGLYKDLRAPRVSPFLTAGLTVIGLLGVAVSATAGNTIKEADKQINAVDKMVEGVDARRVVPTALRQVARLVLVDRESPEGARHCLVLLLLLYGAVYCLP